MAYLAVESDHPQRREALAGLLWPDLPEDAALGNLRKALHHVRQVTGADDLSPPLWQVDAKTIQLNSSQLTLDVTEFLLLLEIVHKHRHRHKDRCAVCRSNLEAATRLYRGDFLQGFSIPDSLAFDEWLLVKREQFRVQALDAFQQFTEISIQLGDFESARQSAQRLVSLEPWHENAHRQLMRLLSRLGQRSAALVQYEKCKQLLWNELGVDPEPATVALYEKIRRGDSETATTAVRHNLPAQLLPFFGREAELSRVRERLLDPTERLVTLVGEGGVGKTRLVLTAAREVAHDFADGVWFVPLAGLTPESTAETVLLALAGAIQFSATGGDFKSQLFSFIQAKEYL